MADVEGAQVVESYFDLAIRPRPPRGVVLFAPCGFNSLNKLAQGIADNLALSVAAEAIGRGTPVIVGPSLNQPLLDHPRAQESLRTLPTWGVTVVPMQDEGYGPRLAPTPALLEAVKPFAPADTDRLHRCRNVRNAPTNWSGRSLEREKGIEPSRLAWEASRLPLHHSREHRVYGTAPGHRQTTGVRSLWGGGGIGRDLRGTHPPISPHDPDRCEATLPLATGRANRPGRPGVSARTRSPAASQSRRRASSSPGTEPALRVGGSGRVGLDEWLRRTLSASRPSRMLRMLRGDARSQVVDFARNAALDQ